MTARASVLWHNGSFKFRAPRRNKQGETMTCTLCMKTIFDDQALLKGGKCNAPPPLNIHTRARHWSTLIPFARVEYCPRPEQMDTTSAH